ncbi:hypothetical protein VTO42DRAFT_3338 [Malbranchea cinnamomea]
MMYGLFYDICFGDNCMIESHHWHNLFFFYFFFLAYTFDPFIGFIERPRQTYPFWHHDFNPSVIAQIRRFLVATGAEHCGRRRQ